MRKKTKTLSGASQDAYFRRVLKSHPTLTAEERDKLVVRLRQEVAQLRVRVVPRRDAEPQQPTTQAPADEPAGRKVAPLQPTIPEPRALPEPAPAAAVTAPFDPFSPNIIVVLRKSGRDAVLAALDAIDSADNLRLLAREQRLNVSAELTSAMELRQAIVAAAERRVANRMAAAT